MTRARKELVSLDATPYYHCVCRCVRRAFLCGEDHYTGNSYEHRRGWIATRIKQLNAVFSIDTAAYAVMHNHYHVVLRVDVDKAKAWTIGDVIAQWSVLFTCPILIQRYQDNEQLSGAELDTVHVIVQEWRQRLTSISWFMRCLNEYIAKRANGEDHCTGRFWEGRFKSQALLDEVAVLACMAYVDLNPIRAGLADRPESSDFTAIQERLDISPSASEIPTESLKEPIPEAPLLAFNGIISNETTHPSIPFHLTDYLELVDWTGRVIRADKRGHIPAQFPPILQRLNINAKQWLTASEHFERDFYYAIGPISKLNEFCKKLDKYWLHGKTACNALYARPHPA